MVHNSPCFASMERWVCTLPRYRTCTPTVDHGTGQHGVNFGTSFQGRKACSFTHSWLQSSMDPPSLPPLKGKDWPGRRLRILDQRLVYRHQEYQKVSSLTKKRAQQTHVNAAPKTRAKSGHEKWPRTRAPTVCIFICAPRASDS